MKEPFALVLVVFLAASFLYFGAACVRTASMRAEFERYGLTRFRVMTGVLQLCGAAGLVVGWWVRPMGVAAAVGLAVLMLLGFGARRKIRDTWAQSVPAGVYALLCVAAAWALWSGMRG
ncbi:MAG: DoxX family protein [Planctomycetota bacterium]